MTMAKPMLGVFLFVLGSLLGCDSESVNTVAPSDSELPAQTSEQRVPESPPELAIDFLEEWEGAYGCKSVGVEPVSDLLRIARGEQDGEYIVTLYVTADNPSVVTGTAR